MNKETRRIICTATIVASAVTIAVATVLWIRSKNEEKKFGGKLINVNYKFSKEFDD
jgi:hypothetical protein